VDRLVADVVHGQPVDQVVIGGVGDHSLLAALDAEPLDPPPVRVIKVERVTAPHAAAVKDRIARAAQRDRQRRRAGRGALEVALVHAGSEQERGTWNGLREGLAQLVGGRHRRRCHAAAGRRRAWRRLRLGHGGRMR